MNTVNKDDFEPQNNVNKYARLRLPRPNVFGLIVIRYGHLPVYDEASFLPPVLLRHAPDLGHQKAVAPAVYNVSASFA